MAYYFLVRKGIYLLSVSRRSFGISWFVNNTNVVIALSNIGTLIVWLVYAQLLYFNFRRQRRPRLVIRRAGDNGLSATCVISNMSAEPIYISYIISEVRYKGENITCDVTDVIKSGHGEPAAEDEGNSVDYRQGPMLSGGYMHIGKYRDLLLKTIELDKGTSIDEAIGNTESVTVYIICIYGSEDKPIGAYRKYFLISNEDAVMMRPASWDTIRLSSMRKRRKLKKEVLNRGEESG